MKGYDTMPSAPPPYTAEQYRPPQPSPMTTRMDHSYTGQHYPNQQQPFSQQLPTVIVAGVPNQTMIRSKERECCCCCCTCPFWVCCLIIALLILIPLIVAFVKR